MRWMIAWLAAAGFAWADGEPAGEFDYYVMALSWSPNFCVAEGRARGSEQCESGAGYGWVLHGLWPQYEDGWPSYCRTRVRDPSRAMTGAMADIMGTSGLAWHQWKKHGRCSGLSARDYFDASRKAFESVTRPPVFRKLDRTVTLPASVVEEAWQKDNPKLSDAMLTVTCKDRRIQEVRICLTKDLALRDCSIGIRRDCDMQNAEFHPVD